MFPKIPRAVIEVVTITSWSDIVKRVSNTLSETVAVERKNNLVRGWNRLLLTTEFARSNTAHLL